MFVYFFVIFGTFAQEDNLPFPLIFQGIEGVLLQTFVRFFVHLFHEGILGENRGRKSQIFQLENVGWSPVPISPQKGVKSTRDPPVAVVGGTTVIRRDLRFNI